MNMPGVAITVAPLDQGQVALAGPQRLHGQVQGDQRRRTGRVDGDGRALEAEGVGDAAGDDAAAAGAGRGHVERVVVVHDAGEDTGGAALEGRRVDA
nr:hypothetical protein GCM10020092_032290 [Actinoplanes digitatis]